MKTCMFYTRKHCQLFFLHVGKKAAFFPTCKKKLAVETGYEARCHIQATHSAITDTIAWSFL